MGRLKRKEKILLAALAIYIVVGSVLVYFWVDMSPHPPDKVIPAKFSIEGTKINNTSYAYTIIILEWGEKDVKWTQLGFVFGYYNETGDWKNVQDDFTLPKVVHYNPLLNKYVIESTGGSMYLYATDPSAINEGDIITTNKSFIKPDTLLRCIFKVPPYYTLLFELNLPEPGKRIYIKCEIIFFGKDDFYATDEVVKEEPVE